MHKMTTEFYGPSPECRSIPAADSELDKINRFTLVPFRTRDRVAAFQMELCNDKIDRHFSRFPYAELVKINRMIVSRPLMVNHDMKKLPKGVFYNSEIKNMGGKTVVAPSFYIPRMESNQDFIENIRAGVFRETSIAFTFDKPTCSICSQDLRQCNHEPGQTYNGHVCVYTMHDVQHVIEGSLVGAGSQSTVVFSERGLPTCGKYESVEAQAGISPLRRGCHGCGKCSCGKGEDVAEAAPINVDTLDDLIVDQYVDQRETPWCLKGYGVLWPSVAHRINPEYSSTGEYQETFRRGSGVKWE